MRAISSFVKHGQLAACVTALALASTMPAKCQNYPTIEGTYSGTEFYSVTVDFFGIEHTEHGSGSISNLEITQSGETFSCFLNVDGKNLTWIGKLKGNKLTSISGPVGFSVFEDEDSASRGHASGNGIVRDGIIVLNLKGSTEGHLLGLSGDLDVETTATLYGPAIAAPDLTPPVIKISTPTANKRLTTPSLTAKGTASDDEVVKQVYVQLNGADWVEATGTRSWTAQFTPVAGVNTLAAYAVDAAGNCSTTNTVCFYQVVNSPLTLLTNGGGKIACKFSGRSLRVGELYTVTAIANSPQWMFAGWSGDVTSPSLALNFTMRSNMTIVANFTSSSFPANQGNYSGLFFEATPQTETSGAFSLSLRNDGTFSGKISQGGTSYSFSAKFDAEGHATTAMPRKGRSPIIADWSLDLTNVTDTINVTLHSDNWTASAVGDRACFDSTHAAPTKGRYTLTFPSPAGLALASTPAGDGWGTVVVNSSGNITFSGALADGTSVHQSATISKAGLWPLYIPLYGGKGMLLSWVSLAGVDQNNFANHFAWSKPQKNSTLYPSGFTNQSQMLVSRFITPTNRNMPILQLTNSVAAWVGGGLTTPIACPIAISSNNVVRLKNPVTATFRYDSNKGTVTGSFWNPDLKKTIPFTGVVLQEQSVVRGYFLGAEQSGLFSIQGDR